MILFPDCKINLGLDIPARRPDGYHEIRTLMLPVPGLCDALELLPSAQTALVQTGLTVDCAPERNLCLKTCRLMQERYGIPEVEIHLHKAVPFGAGLGGGSADAAFTIRGLSELFHLGLSIVEMESLAAELGSDTVFFIRNTPAFASGRGEILIPWQWNASSPGRIEPASPEQDSAIASDPLRGEVSPETPLPAFPGNSTTGGRPIPGNPLSGKHLLLIKPTFGVGTAEAYSGITPCKPEIPLEERLKAPLSEWKTSVTNAFEPSVFRLYPRLAELKRILYDLGALYASLSGSGSALYGIFDREVPANDLPGDLFVHQEVII